EGLLALQLERNFSKEEILQLYLNQIYFGHGAYGVQAAARIYFGKDVAELSLAECALLAGQITYPGGYSPFVYPGRARMPRAAWGAGTHARGALYNQGGGEEGLLRADPDPAAGAQGHPGAVPGRACPPPTRAEIRLQHAVAGRAQDLHHVGHEGAARRRSDHG